MLKLNTQRRTAPFVVEYPAFEAMKVLTGHVALNRRLSALRGKICLYLHIPFCRYRCHFCYYKVLAAPAADVKRRYVDALLGEIRRYARLLSARNVEVATVYFGGGTPTYLSGDELARIYECVAENFKLGEDLEFTVEVEPGTASPEKLRALKSIGVNRLSVGAEQFDDTLLRLNGRPHRASAIVRCVERAREHGFDNINIDLITGLLNDSLEVWPATMAQLLELAPEYVSLYRLQVLPNTIIAQTGQPVFGRAVVDHEVETSIARFAYNALEQHGYIPHTSFSYAKTEKYFHVHRELAWTNFPLIGAGVSSYSTIPGLLYQNTGNFDNYLSCIEKNKQTVTRAHFLSAFEMKMRTLILGIKLGRVDFSAIDPDLLHLFEPELDALPTQGLGVLTPSGIKLTQSGRIFADDIIQVLIQKAVPETLSKVEHRQLSYAD